ncbi:MAG: hypothetical protein ABGZ35_01160 [Planctomycetaceae bacterium]
MKKLIDRLLGKPSAVCWVIKTVVVCLAYLTCYVPIGVAVVVWAYHVPSAVALVWSSVPRLESTPNKKRTPKKSRPWERLDDFDDVRVRVSELTQ